MRFRNLFVPEVSAKFTYHETMCNCGTANYFSKSIIHEEVPLCPSWIKKVLNRPFHKLTESGEGPPQDVSHESILIEFKCRSCGFEFPLTYNFFFEGKKVQYGHYSRRISIKETSEQHLPFDYITGIYKQMPGFGSYRWRKFNCKHWSRNFMKKLIGKIEEVNDVTENS